jgi:hypothetical protein
MTDSFFTRITTRSTLSLRLSKNYPLILLHARADLQSGRIEYEHLQCEFRIKNPDTQGIGIANPDERRERRPLAGMNNYRPLAA